MSVQAVVYIPSVTNKKDEVQDLNMDTEMSFKMCFEYIKCHPIIHIEMVHVYMF